MKRIIIGLCDDELFVYKEVKQLLLEYQKIYQRECEVIYYPNAQSLLEANDSLECLLLDIEMPQMDGIELAKRLNRQGREYRIVMLTGRVDRYKEAFQIQAFRFVSKPIVKEELFEALDDVQKQRLGEREVCVYRDNVAYTLPQRDIIFIMANKASTIIYTLKQDYRSEMLLKDWETELDTRLFFRCHKSYIVNLSRIEEIKKDEIIVSTGERLPVSRREKNSLRQAFMEYDTQ